MSIRFFGSRCGLGLNVGNAGSAPRSSWISVGGATRVLVCSRACVPNSSRLKSRPWLQHCNRIRFLWEGELNKGVIIVLGMGEVGQPLFRILSKTFDCVAVDIESVEIAEPCDVLHVCYPFQVPDFVGTTARYLEKYDP